MILSELRASAYRIASLVFGVLAVTLLVGCMFLWVRATRADVRADAASDRAQASEARERALTKALETERESAKRANAIAEQYEQDKRNAEAAGKRTADDLRAGNLRLRAQWQGCETRRMPATPGSASEFDAAADDRADSAGRIIGAADAADAQIRALQQFIREALK